MLRSADPIPEHIGPYVIRGRLGSGGMATVYRAEQPALGRQVALKVVAPHLAGDAQFRARFLREAQAGAKISHPHVVTCYDAGEQDGRLYMALELVTGGDLIGVLERRGGRLDEVLAAQLVRDCCAGLEAIEAAGMIHRDLKPANIFITETGAAKLADLGLARIGGSDQVTQPGMIMGTPAYIAPEQANGLPDLDIRADLYALGATWFHLVTGAPPFSSDNPMTTLVKALNEPIPDPRSRRSDLSEISCEAMLRLLEKDRSGRPASAAMASILIARVLAQLSGRPAQAGAPAQERSGAVPVLRPATPTSIASAAPVPAAAVTPVAPATPARAAVGSDAMPAPVRIDPAQLDVLCKRVLVASDGMTASIVLAPGASFPRFLLEAMLNHAGIRHGLIDGALHEATRISQVPRRLILARGDPPSPGMGGLDVRGDPVPPCESTVTIVVADDAQTAIALCRPAQCARKSDLERGIKTQGLRFGLDADALRKVVDGPPVSDGRVVIARGRPMRPGRAAGFLLADAIAAATSVGSAAVGAAHLQQVGSNDLLAIWSEPEAGADGMDVLGRKLPAPQHDQHTPEDLAGEGTGIGRDRDGRLVLRALRQGMCLRDPDGSIRVVGVLEIAGDIGPEDPPIDTDDVLVIRGSVKPGARIASSADVVICGDLHDAAISAGGSLQVAGTIRSGDQPLIVAETLTAGAVEVRRVLAGSVRIHGEVRNCEITCTGDIRIDRVIGGRLTAGGDIQAGQVGDSDGTTTELWAGHSLSYGEQEKLHRLSERRREIERTRLVEEAARLHGDLADAGLKHQRMSVAQFARKDELQRIEERMRLLEHAKGNLARAAEEHRQELERSRRQAAGLRAKQDNTAAHIRIDVVAHQGVIARLADIEPDVLREPRLRYHLRV